MSYKHYQISDLLKEAMRLHSSLLMALMDTCLTANTFQLLSCAIAEKGMLYKKQDRAEPVIITMGADGKEEKRYAPRASLIAVNCILHHIAERTLQHGKSFEFVSVKEIVEGVPGVCCPPALVSRYAVKRALQFMCPPNARLLIRLDFNHIRVPCYSINWPVVVPIIQKTMSGLLAYKTNGVWYKTSAPSYFCLKTLDKLALCSEAFKRYKPGFTYLEKQRTVSDVDAFIHGLAPKFSARPLYFEEALKRINSRKGREQQAAWRACIRADDFRQYRLQENGHFYTLKEHEEMQRERKRLSNVQSV